VRRVQHAAGARERQRAAGLMQMHRQIAQRRQTGEQIQQLHVNEISLGVDRRVGRRLLIAHGDDVRLREIGFEFAVSNGAQRHVFDQPIADRRRHMRGHEAHERLYLGVVRRQSEDDMEAIHPVGGRRAR